MKGRFPYHPKEQLIQDLLGKQELWVTWNKQQGKVKLTAAELDLAAGSS